MLVSNVWLRRTEAAPGQVIAFPRDVSWRMLQVPLIDSGAAGACPSSPRGANLSRVAAPRRQRDAAHDDSVAHGVTELTYALFLLDEPAAS